MKAPIVWALPAVIVVLVLRYVSTLTGLSYSFTDLQGVGEESSFVGLDNFVEVFKNPSLRPALMNTLTIAISYVIIVNVLALLLAVGLHRAARTGGISRSLVFLPVVMSSVVIAYAWQFILAPNGAINQVLTAVGLGDFAKAWLADPTWALWCILLVMVWQTVGLPMVIYMAGLQSISKDIDEAATIDGARFWRHLRTVTLPLLAPSITVASTLSLISGLEVFDLVMALTRGGPAGATQTLATVMYDTTWVRGHYGLGAAIAVTLMLLVIVASVIQVSITRRLERKMR
ncbi:carbohydrate ABC transporter permease [Microbacterium sp.]|uniref:carbohydrate ABC transporter permease n=1 Tax=Microbacterium sp. TaxID=51671 RepID=UPI0039E219DE